MSCLRDIPFLFGRRARLARSGAMAPAGFGVTDAGTIFARLSEGVYAGSGAAGAFNAVNSKRRAGSWLNRFLWPLIRLGGRRTKADSTWTPRERAAVLHGACEAIRTGCWDDAQVILESAGDRGSRDAAWLNLVGVLHEARAQWKLARRYYGKAMRADPRYSPARQNMRRWFELFTFGRSKEPVMLGDEVAPMIS